jgi:flagellar biosynthesis/type III secretory pathway protein FliH
LREGRGEGMKASEIKSYEHDIGYSEGYKSGYSAAFEQYEAHLNAARNPTPMIVDKSMADSLLLQTIEANQAEIEKLKEQLGKAREGLESVVWECTDKYISIAKVTFDRVSEALSAIE